MTSVKSNIGLQLGHGEIRVHGLCLCGDSLETFRLLSDEEQKTSGIAKVKNFAVLHSLGMEIRDGRIFLRQSDGVYRAVPV